MLLDISWLRAAIFSVTLRLAKNTRRRWTVSSDHAILDPALAHRRVSTDQTMRFHQVLSRDMYGETSVMPPGAAALLPADILCLRN